MSLYTSVSRKFTRVLVKKEAWKSAKTVGKTAVVKTAVVKAVAYIVSMDRKTTVYRVEAGKIVFFFWS